MNIEYNKIYNQSCLEILKDIPDQEIDLVVTSPPYNMNLRIRGNKYVKRSYKEKGFSTKYDGFKDDLPIDEFYNLHKSILTELLRTSKIIFYNIQIVTGSKKAFFKLIGDFSEELKDIIVWDKGHGQPSMLPAVLNRQSELILIFDSTNAISRQFDKVNFKRGELSDTWKINRGKKILKEHSAVFPEELVEKIILNFSDENDLIYDPFSGTGTTCYVAKKLNRRFLGTEIVKKYFDFSNERINQLNK
jgi:site-specific DNA-methyltransferase (adenine-specific)/modification methylase